MRLSVDIYGIREAFGDERAVELLRETGFDCFDYHCYTNGRRGNMLDDDYLEHAHAMRQMAEAYGLVCNQAHAPFTFKRGENTVSLEDPLYREMVRSIEFASVLGAENIVFHPIGTLPEAADFWQYNLDFFKSLEPYCEQFHIPVAIENLFCMDRARWQFIGMFHTPQSMREFLRQLSSPWFGACVDTGHVAITGGEPESYIRGMDQTLRAVHIHDNDWRRDFHQLPYTGLTNWDNVTRALGEIGYQGDLTLEILGCLRRFDEELLPDVLKLAEKIGRNLIRKVERVKREHDAGGTIDE